MRKLARRLIQKLPRETRISVYRRLARIELGGPISRLRFSIVRSIDELVPVYRMLYAGFRESNYAPENPVALHLNPYFLLGSTYTIAATLDRSPIASLSVILDNPFGLPADGIVDLGALRKLGPVAEIGSLSIAREYRHLSGEILGRFAIFSFRLAILRGAQRHTVSRSAALLTDFYCACFGWRYLTQRATVDPMTNNQKMHVSAFTWPDGGEFFRRQPCTIHGRRRNVYHAAVEVELEDLAIPARLSDVPALPADEVLRVFLATRSTLNPLERRIIQSSFSEDAIAAADRGRLLRSAER